MFNEIDNLIQNRVGKTEFIWVQSHTGKKDGNHIAD